MKVPFLLVLLLCCTAPFSQPAIKISETDTASKLRRIETNSKWVNKGLGNGFAIGLRSEGPSIFVQLYIFPVYNGLIAEDDPLLFTLENDTTISALSNKMQLRARDYRKPYEYIISLAEVKTLSRFATKMVSFYSAGGNARENKIAPQDQKDIQQVCLSFLKEYEKKPQGTTSNKQLVMDKKHR